MSCLLGVKPIAWGATNDTTSYQDNNVSGALGRHTSLKQVHRALVSIRVHSRFAFFEDRLFCVG